jgi:asparagine synthetase B (glutamine-hydrolysing)
MKIARSVAAAKELSDSSEPFFYTHFNSPLYRKFHHGDLDHHVIGRKYRGLFDENDGSYVTLTKARSGDVVINRDSYGSIPLFYSVDRAAVATDLRLLVDIDRPDLDPEAVAEYLSASYLTAGRTIYEGIHCLMPNETIILEGSVLRIQQKEIFPQQILRSEKEASDLIEQALDNSIDDLLRRFPGTISVNLSGGTDSTLLLAKIREREPGKDIVTTTYFHDDWRDDLDDWKYADQASRKFGSRHQLTNIDNEIFCRAHRELLGGLRSVFHTYAAAFYAQNKAICGLDHEVPILNGSGPDESIIGTEKIPISDLLSLRSLSQSDWIDYLTSNIDYIKLPEDVVTGMLRGKGVGFVQSRKGIAATLLDSANFVEFQRRYHALTILQDHIQELSSVARLHGRPILFPYLTNDMFRIIFSCRFETLNFQNIYKSAMKRILEKYMSMDFIHRKKIGFQSPSRPYFRSGKGLGRELSRLLSKRSSSLLDLDLVIPGIQERLKGDIDLYRRYDFLEWTVYNILLLEELRRESA